MYKVQIIGLNELQAKLAKLPGTIKSEVNGVMTRGGQVFVRAAQRDSPIDMSFLRRGITFMPNPVVNMTVEFISSSEYSSYMEFGTKARVRIPPQFATYAAQFKSTGKGNSGKGFYNSILEWVKRKGIGAAKTKSGRPSKSSDSLAGQEQVAYLIYRSILRHGVKPHPFFFKNLPLAKETIETGIRAITSNLKL